MKAKRTRRSRFSRTAKMTIIAIGAIIMISGFFTTAYVLSNQTTSTTTSSQSTSTTNQVDTSSKATSTKTSSYQTSGLRTITINGSLAKQDSFGNAIDVGLLSGFTNLKVSSQSKVSIRFTAPTSGRVQGLSINAFSDQASGEILIGLQNDSGGTPSGNWMGGDNNYAKVSVSSSQAWVKGNLPSQVNVQYGSVYYIVAESAPSSQGSAEVNVFLANSPYQPLNVTDPDINWQDGEINTLLYSGNQWTLQNKYPMFTVILANGSEFGQPYSLAAPWVIYGTTYAGQEFIPTYTYEISRIAFVVGDQDSPKDDLYYSIYDSSNNLLESGKFAAPNQVSSQWEWRQINLTKPVTFDAGKVYRVVLYSPNTDLKDAYQLIGFEFSQSVNPGYGGLQSMLVASLDGGKTWGDWADADAIFQFSGVPS